MLRTTHTSSTATRVVALKKLCVLLCMTFGKCLNGGFKNSMKGGLMSKLCCKRFKPTVTHIYGVDKIYCQGCGSMTELPAYCECGKRVAFHRNGNDFRTVCRSCGKETPINFDGKEKS